MRIKSMEFLISAVKPQQYPEEPLPEIAFAGRSNVGKSSMINMLLNRRNFARTSSTPGKTQTINFYEIDKAFRFVDLPGYGYAKVSKTQHESWGKIMNTYLNKRENLLEVIQLVDIRHKPSAQDKNMYEWILETGFNGIIIATKADKMSKGQIQKQLNIIRKELGAKEKIIIPISTLSKLNKYEVWDLFNGIFEANDYDIHLERQDDSK
ncbi:MAG: YihA family ribosome biogenesis GTP-binding protein [Clostridiales bacterium]|nr:YihA family ribosome biogenesis GTP-binding protein [Clostridiales bacterium]